MNSLNVFNNSEPNETFEDVKEFLSNIDSINSGGCGLSALVMYRWLKKYNKLSEGTKILFLDNDLNNHLNNKECMSNKEGVLCTMMMVKMVLNIVAGGALQPKMLMTNCNLFN